MNTYEAIVRKDNEKKKIKFEAKTEEEAEILILEISDELISLKKTNNNIIDFLLKRGLTPEERITFLNTLSTLYISAVPLIKALDLISTNFGGNIKRVSNSLKQKIEMGIEPQDAIGYMGEDDFPNTTVAMIKSGASSGNLGSALKEAAIFEKEMSELEKDSKQGIFFHVVGFLIACSAIIACKYWFVPYVYEKDIAHLVNNFDLTPVHTFTNMVNVSILFFLCILSVLYFTKNVGRRINPHKADKVIRKIPLYSNLILSKMNFISIYQLSKLIEKGVSYRESLEITANNMEKGLLKKDFENSIVELENGRNWATALTTFNDIQKASLEASSDNKNVAKILKELSNTNKSEYIKSLENIKNFFYWFTIIYLSLAAIILFLYTSLPIMNAIQNSFGIG